MSGAGNRESAVDRGKADAGGLGKVLVVEAGARRSQPDLVGGDGPLRVSGQSRSVAT